MPLPSFIYFTIFVHDIFYCAVFVQKSSPTSFCERVFLPVIGNFFLRQEISSYGTKFLSMAGHFCNISSFWYKIMAKVLEFLFISKNCNQSVGFLCPGREEVRLGSTPIQCIIVAEWGYCPASLPHGWDILIICFCWFEWGTTQPPPHGWDTLIPGTHHEAGSFMVGRYFTPDPSTPVSPYHQW